LISSDDHSVLEVNKQGKIVWQFTQRTRREYKFIIFQEVNRLANGNTVIWQLVSAQPGPEVLARHGAGAGSDAGRKKLSGVERMERSRPRPGCLPSNCWMNRARRKFPANSSGEDLASHIVCRRWQSLRAALAQ